MTNRFDIQFMRGVAVLAVVVFHAFGEAFPKGFLGVDVFFVISGFLITGIILKGLASPEGFSFTNFYVRRAKRLLPASLTTLAVTTAVAFFVLTRSQWGDYAEQVLGSLAFVANFVLASQTGYFEGAAETKPLLHIWSLSLEEQFYFVAPLLLWLTPLRHRPWLLLAGMVASLALCIVLMTGPSWLPFSSKGAQKLAFFMLPTRAWELLAGSLCAWWMLRHPQQIIPGWLKFAALGIIVLACTFGLDPVHPRGDALVVVLATVVILMGKDGWLPANRLTQPVRLIGDWSYSLYLIHWPLFSFAFIVYGETPPVVVLTALAAAAVVLAWLQYTYVELPLKGDWRGRRPGRLAVVGTMGAGLLAVAVPTMGAAIPDSQLGALQGLDLSCETRSGTWVDRPECRTSDAPAVALWGDSYAMHLVPGLRTLPMVQVTKSACAPVQGVAQVSDKYTASWARDCVAFNESALAAIVAMPSVSHVVIGSIWVQALTDEDSDTLLVGDRIEPFSDAGAAGLVRAIERLKAAGKTPILIAPTPRATFDAGRCNERQLEGRVILGRSVCDISETEARQASARIDSRLRAIGQQTGVEVLFPASVLCPGGALYDA